MRGTGMHDIKDILRHRHDLGLPRAQVAATVGGSRGAAVRGLSAWSNVRNGVGTKPPPVCFAGHMKRRRGDNRHDRHGARPEGGQARCQHALSMLVGCARVRGAVSKVGDPAIEG